MLVILISLLIGEVILRHSSDTARVQETIADAHKRETSLTPALVAPLSL